MSYSTNAYKSYQNKRNNAQGHFFERVIESGCKRYKAEERANINKTPEPFRVLAKERNGIFKGRFTANAEPDFIGTLKNGRAIVFEAKYTSTEKMKRNVLSSEQIKALRLHHKLGAVAGVCIGIKDLFYFIPFEVWEDMKKIYGRQYLKKEDIEEYEVKFNGSVLFLDYKSKNREVEF